jgi:SAM-dependent methyltransferase
MSSETGKSIHRRIRDPLFYLHVFKGAAIDIGAGPDGLSQYAYLFPLLTSVRDWDLPDGDANVMEGLTPESFDLVHSSHTLEHMVAVDRALARWWELVRPGGFLVFTVPDEAMYEQGVWPSTFNPDHKWSFRTDDRVSMDLGNGNQWTLRNEAMQKSRSVVLLVMALPFVQPIRIERLIATWDQSGPRRDQTISGPVESAIEVICRKAIPGEGPPWS